jgi:4-alpha-glucanotransferase
MRWACRNFDMVRIDHFRGFESFWEIPAAEPNAIRGYWVKGPGDELFSALRAALGDLPVLAEDLGMITAEVHALRRRIGIPGMKVLQFGFSDPGAHIYLPHNFEPNCVVYTGTHDNDTTLGWWNSSATPDEKRRVRAYAGDGGDGIHWTLVRMAYASVARLAVAPMQDVLGLGSESRMNIPSRESGNWSWRMSPGSLTSALAEKLAALVEICDRMPGSAAAEAGEESAYAA